MTSRISAKLLLLLIFGALLPMLFFGAAAIYAARRATFVSVTTGHQRMAARAAAQIHQYLENTERLLQALGNNVRGIRLSPSQQDRMFKNYVLDFKEFSRIYLADEKGRKITTSEVGESALTPAEQGEVTAAIAGPRVARSPVYMTADLMPAMRMAVPLFWQNRVVGALVGEVSLVAMWELADSIHIGKTGVCHILDETGRFIASGSGPGKVRVLRGEIYPHRSWMERSSDPDAFRYRNPEGEAVLGAAAPVQGMGWQIIVEQSTDEAYITARIMTWMLIGLTMATLIIMSIIGAMGGRRGVVEPIHALQKAARTIGLGDLTYRVTLKSTDEFGELAKSINEMAEKLEELHEKIRQEERFSMFGRIAAGLVHDLKHPIGTIETAATLLRRNFDDSTQRERFQAIVKREFDRIHHFMDDLHQLTHSRPYQPVVLPVPALLDEAMDSFQDQATARGIVFRKERAASLSPRNAADNLYINADKFSILRVFSNLISNAIEAMAPGGQLTVRTRQDELAQQIYIDFSDTGKGITQDHLKQLFTDFRTTKRTGRGLGLGLAICRKLTVENGGTIQVQSEVNKGTTFTVSFPLHDPAAKAAVV